MLQRVQTVYLFLVFVFSLLYLIFPLATLDNGEIIIQAYKIDGIPNEFIKEDNKLTNFLQIVLPVMVFAIMILSIYTTFMYRKRMYQIKLSRLNILLLLILVVASFFFADTIKNNLSLKEISYGVSLLFPFISMILLLLAIKAIKKDEALVRSADRIR